VLHREAVKIMIQQASPSIICIQETKLDSMDRFLAMEFLEADSTRGGILVAWNQDLVHAEAPSRQRFTLTLKLSNSSFLLTLVYGPTDDSLKPMFLEELIDCQTTAGTAWLCLGNFNLIYEVRDKNNSNINRRLMGRFCRALDASELMELRLQNRRYTWNKGRARPTLVHLDRVFCIEEWDVIFPAVNLQALSSSLSDHSPLFLGSQQQAPRAISFKFEQFWTRVPAFLDIVASAWNSPVRGTSPLMIFYIHLSTTARSLRHWSKTLFSEAQTQLLMANEVILRLDTVQESRALTSQELVLHKEP